MGNRQLKWWHDLGTYGKPRTVCVGIILPLQVERKPPTVCIWMIVLPLQVGRKPPTVCMGDCITFTGGEKATDCVYR